MKIQDSVFLVTGGGSGLGAATARLAFERGASVALLDLPSSAGPSLADEMGDRAMFVPADVTKTHEVERATREVAERFGRIDVCVNCAGVVVLQRTIDEDGKPADLDEFNRAVAINLTGTFDVARRAAHYMAQNKPDDDGLRGIVINTSSVAGVGGQAGSIGYATSKAAVAGMTLPMARDLAPWGIRVVAIAPGPMETPMLGESSAKSTGVLPNVLLPRRAGRPDEYADLVLFLVGNNVVNAEVIRLDMGGRPSRGGSADEWTPL